MQMVLQEIITGRLPTALESQLCDGFIAHRGVDVIEFAQAHNIGNGFNIEYEDGGQWILLLIYLAK